jgi:hypothetical protein
VLEIRRFLTAEIGKLDDGSEFASSLRAMRTACRKFLERAGVDGDERTVLYANHRGHWASWSHERLDKALSGSEAPGMAA